MNKPQGKTSKTADDKYVADKTKRVEHLNHIQSLVKAYCAKIAKITPADANTTAIFFMGGTIWDVKICFRVLKGQT